MEPFLGEIRAVCFNFEPVGWVQCDGRLLSIAQNQALFSLIGTTYGGDGRTTFGLPDLRGRCAIGEGNGPGLSPYRMGWRPGQESIAVDLPKHTHHITGLNIDCKLKVANKDANTSEPEGNYLAKAKTAEISSKGVKTCTEAAESDLVPLKGIEFNTSGDVKISTEGHKNTHYSNMQPSLVINYIIATDGIFPPRK